MKQPSVNEMALVNMFRYYWALVYTWTVNYQTYKVNHEQQSSTEAVLHWERMSWMRCINSFNRCRAVRGRLRLVTMHSHRDVQNTLLNKRKWGLIAVKREYAVTRTQAGLRADKRPTTPLVSSSYEVSETTLSDLSQKNRSKHTEWALEWGQHRVFKRNPQLT